MTEKFSLNFFTEAAIGLQGVPTEKNWANWFSTKQKTNIPKTHKSELGVLGDNIYYVNNNH